MQVLLIGFASLGCANEPSSTGYPAESGSGELSWGGGLTQLGAARYCETCRNAVNTIFRREDACFSLSTRQRENGMNGRNEVSDTIHYCRVVLQHGSGSGRASDL